MLNKQKKPIQLPWDISIISVAFLKQILYLRDLENFK